MFSNKQVVCVEYSGLTDADERDIFQVRSSAAVVHQLFIRIT